jgi:hypothetical protein
MGRVIAADLYAGPDALIVVGTTLRIPGVKRLVKDMCRAVHYRNRGLTVWMNKDAPPVDKDYTWDLIVYGPCNRVAEHADLPRWDGLRPMSVASGKETEPRCVLTPATTPVKANRTSLKHRFNLYRKSKAQAKQKTGDETTTTQSAGVTRNRKVAQKRRHTHGGITFLRNDYGRVRSIHELLNALPDYTSG